VLKNIYELQIVLGAIITGLGILRSKGSLLLDLQRGTIIVILPLME